MKFTNKFSMKAQSAVAFIMGQILFKTIFEFEGSRIFTMRQDELTNHRL